MDQEVKLVIKDSLVLTVFQVKLDKRDPMVLEASLELAVFLVAKVEPVCRVTTVKLALQAIAAFMALTANSVNLVRRVNAAARAQLAKVRQSFPTSKCLKYHSKRDHQVILVHQVSQVILAHLVQWVRWEPLVRQEIPVKMETLALLDQWAKKVKKGRKVS